jgi:hypothetical protein
MEQELEQHKIGDQYPSNSGGTVVYTRTGLIHKAGRRYAGDLEADDTGLDNEGAPVVKRGRGRPKKQDIQVNL